MSAQWRVFHRWIKARWHDVCDDGIFIVIPRLKLLIPVSYSSKNFHICLHFFFHIFVFYWTQQQSISSHRIKNSSISSQFMSIEMWPINTQITIELFASRKSQLLKYLKIIFSLKKNPLIHSSVSLIAYLYTTVHFGNAMHWSSIILSFVLIGCHCNDTSNNGFVA